MRRTARSWAIVAARLADRDSSPARSAARRRTSSAWAWRVLPLILTSLWASCACSVADTALNGRGTVGLGHVPNRKADSGICPNRPRSGLRAARRALRLPLAADDPAATGRAVRAVRRRDDYWQIGSLQDTIHG